MVNVLDNDLYADYGDIVDVNGLLYIKYYNKLLWLNSSNVIKIPTYVTYNIKDLDLIYDNFYLTFPNYKIIISLTDNVYDDYYDKYDLMKIDGSELELVYSDKEKKLVMVYQDKRRIVQRVKL